jgi:hypothetical protein
VNRKRLSLLTLTQGPIFDIKIPFPVHVLIVTFILLLSTQSFAQEGEDQFYVINDWSKGLGGHVSTQSSGAYSNELLNVRTNVEVGSLAKRDSLLSYGDGGSSAITGLHRYYRSDGNSYLLSVNGTQLKCGNDDTGTFTVLKQGLNDGKRWQFVTYQDVAIGMDGYDRAIKFDGNLNITANTSGHRTANNSVAELGAPFAQLNTGTTLTAAKWYQYKMAFWDGSTYDYSDARSNSILTGADVHSVMLTDIPLGPTGTTNRYLYRTIGNATQAGVEACPTVYMVANITNNTGQVYLDVITDTSAAGDSAPSWALVTGATSSNATPPFGAYCAIQSERLFVAGDPNAQSNLYFSDQYNPNHFLPTDLEYIRPDDGDKITALKNPYGVLAVFKTNTIQKYYTEGAKTTWYTSDPYSYVGCPAPYSAANTPAGVIYLGRNGLYTFNGQSSVLISDAVTDRIEDISQTNLPNTVGFYHNNQYYLAYSSDEAGLNRNDHVLLYDLIRNSYVVDTMNVSAFAAFDSGTDFGTLYGGSSISDGYIFAFSGGSTALRKKYKTEISAGTFNDTRVYGSEDSPVIEIAWDCTIDGWLTEMQTRDAHINTIDDSANITNSTIDRPDTDGYWTSPVYQINASSLDKLYWNENLGSYGDVNWQIRTNNTAAKVVTTAWSSNYTNPSGSDVSGLAAGDGREFIQLQAWLTTTNTSYTPTLSVADGYLFKLEYSKVGTAYEDNVTSVWESGWEDFGVAGYKKLIKRIKVFYTGTYGNMTFNYRNEEGDVNQNFTIDLSVEPNADINDRITGEGDDKVYTYMPPISNSSFRGATGQLWRFGIIEPGNTTWTLDKVEVKFANQPLYD